MCFNKLFSIFILLLLIFVVLNAKENLDHVSDAEGENEDEDKDEVVQESIGDILLPKGLTVEEFTSAQARSWFPLNLWPKRQVYYEMDDSVSEELRDIIREAFKIWESGSCLNFTEGCQDLCIRVTTTNPAHGEDDCYSNVGAIPGGQFLNLGPTCEELNIVIHEIGHALGFYHEMNRFDTKSFLAINEHSLKEGFLNFFIKLVEDDGTDYDVTSIMQYEANVGTIDPMTNAVASLNPHYQALIGTSKLPSFRDWYRLNKLYSCSSDCPNKDVRCENGGFLSPYKGDGKECFCVCPPRIEGSTCEKVPETYDYYDVPSCSRNVTEETVIQTPNYPHLNQPPEKCSWWIQAPEGRRVQVEFEDFSFAPQYAKGCYTDKVEIRYKNLYYGDMVCDEQIKGETYTSSSNFFIIIILVNEKKDRPEDLRGLSAKVTFV